MASLQQPLRFVPFLRPMVWGGRRLGQLGKDLPSEDRFGEAWDISDHANHRSVVAEGPHAGETLRFLMENYREALLGKSAEKHLTFPWLFKFLDCEDWLSVQVHPDEEAVVRLLPGEGSKTECWFIFDAAPESRIYAGLMPGVGPDELRQALTDGNVTKCLHQFTPEPGDCLFLRAGTVHAVGGGVLMAEIQQTSDATFRLYDWGRRDAQGKSRQLHLDEAFASIHWEYGPVDPVKVEAFDKDTSAEQSLVRCPYFELEFVRSNEPIPVGGSGKLQVFAVLAGSAKIDGLHLSKGQVWLLPADMAGANCVPDSSVAIMRCSLP